MWDPHYEKTSVLCILSYIAEPVGNDTKVCMRLLLRRTQLSWKKRTGFWKYHKVQFCMHEKIKIYCDGPILTSDAPIERYGKNYKDCIPRKSFGLWDKAVPKFITLVLTQSTRRVTTHLLKSDVLFKILTSSEQITLPEHWIFFIRIRALF